MLVNGNVLENKTDYMKVGEVAKIFGVSVAAVRNFEYTRNFKPDLVTDLGTRLYKKENVLTFLENSKRKF